MNRRLPSLSVRLTPLLCLGLLGWLALLSAKAAPASWSAAADPAAPAVQALGMLHQVVARVGECLQRRDLASIHLEDVLVHSAMATLQDVVKQLPPVSQTTFTNHLGELAKELGELHYYADVRKQADAERRLLLVMQALGKIKSHFPEPTLRAATALAERFACPRHPTTTGLRTDICRSCGMEFLQQVRLMPGHTRAASAADSGTRAVLRTAAPLAVGKAAEATLTLVRGDGTSLFSDDLLETHGQRLQMFLVDAGLSELHYALPTHSARPGEFSFAFTPRKPGNYFAWVDARPAPSGWQEDIATSLASDGTGEPFTNRAPVSEVNIGGLKFALRFNTPVLRAGVPAGGRLRVSRADGSGFDQLEPVAGAFVQWFGICEDRQTVFRFSSKGRPVLKAQARGGADTEFICTAPRGGFVRLFAVVQVAGVPVAATFGVVASP
jgi:hypothetical protein